MSSSHLKRSSHQTQFGVCNESCMARGTRQLHGKESTRARLKAVGFESGVSNPVLLRCEKMDASIVVHGDDFMTLGDDAFGEVEHVMSSNVHEKKFGPSWVRVAMTPRRYES